MALRPWAASHGQERSSGADRKGEGTGDWVITFVDRVTSATRLSFKRTGRAETLAAVLVCKPALLKVAAMVDRKVLDRARPDHIGGAKTLESHYLLVGT